MYRGPLPGSRVERGATCRYCGAELRFHRTVRGNLIPLNREASDAAGYVAVVRGVASVLHASRAIALREEGFPLFTVHECKGSRAERDRRRRFEQARAAVDRGRVGRIEPDAAPTQLALTDRPITTGNVADLARFRAKRAERGGRP